MQEDFEVRKKQPMRVLLTGIAGFAGSHLAEYLLGENGSEVEIHGVVHRHDRRIQHLRNRLHLHRGDLRNALWVSGAGEDDFDDPTTGTGYEGALVFAVAEQLGFEPDQVEFVRTGFDEVIAPGEKDWDFNIQQYTITAERDDVVDFSDGYYSARQAIIGAADGPAASATSVGELQDLRIGAAIGTTSLDYADEIIAPTSDVLVFDDNAAAKAAFDAGQVDAIVFDVPTAYFVTATEITDAAIIGVLPEGGESDELGMLFEEGNPLVDCVNEALANLEADGSLAAFEEEWLSQGGDIPTLSE